MRGTYALVSTEDYKFVTDILSAMWYQRLEYACNGKGSCSSTSNGGAFSKFATEFS